MTYRPPAFEAFVAPARGTSQVWLTALGLILAVLIYAFVVVIVLGAAWALAGFEDVSWFDRLLLAETPDALITLLITFVGMALGVFGAVAMLHERSIGSLFGRAPIVLRDFVIAAGVTGAVLGASVIVWFQINDALPGLDVALWLKLLPIALVLLLIQTGAEELVFRGYLQQQLGARFASPFVWALVPSLLFGIAHFDVTTAGDNALIVVAATTIFGLFAADLTARSGSIGAAWGFHFANNFFALLVIGTQGTLTGLARYITPYGMDDVAAIRQGIPLDLLVMVAIWLVLRRLVSR